MGQSQSLRQCGYITYEELETQTKQAQRVIDILNQRLKNTIEANRKMKAEFDKNKEAFYQFKLEMSNRLKENGIQSDSTNEVIDNVTKEWSNKIDTLNNELNDTLETAEKEMVDELKTINDRVESWKNMNNNNNNLLISGDEELALTLLKSLTNTKYASNRRTYEVACQMISGSVALKNQELSTELGDEEKALLKSLTNTN